MSLRERLKSHGKDLFGEAPGRADLVSLLEKKAKGTAVSGAKEVEVTASSLEEAFEIASKTMGVDAHKLSYRVIETSGGLLGKKRMRVGFTALVSKRNVDLGDLYVPGEGAKMDSSKIPRDGFVELDVTRKGKFLLIHPPRAGGGPATEEMVKNLLAEKNVGGVDDAVIRALLRKNDGRPFKVGEWFPNLKNDGKVFFEMSDDRMKGLVRIIPPKFDGRFPDEEDIRASLAESRVGFGVDHAKIHSIVEKRMINIPVLVAEGQPVVHGQDARIDLKVQFRDPNQPLVIAEDEEVDYANLGLIVNVMAGEVLAEKIPSKPGTPGTDLFGQVIAAREGKDVDLVGGENTNVSRDGLTLTAAVNGHAVREGGRVAVKPVFTVAGDVGPQTGHITNMGSVIVTGNVLDGYNVKAGGNIEVKGTVGSGTLEAAGDITIKLGMAGRGEGKAVSQEGSVFAKYFQEAHIRAGKDVIVAEGMINCHTDCGGIVLLNGKKGGLVGGVTRATRQVKARILGSAGYVKTVIQVGVPPEIRRGVESITRRIEEAEPQIAPLKLDISTLKTQSLDDEKKVHLAELEEKLKGLESQLEEDKKHLAQLAEIIANSPVEGKVVAAKNLFSKVEITVNTAVNEIGRDQTQGVEMTCDPTDPEKIKFSPFKSVNNALTLEDDDNSASRGSSEADGGSKKKPVGAMRFHHR